MMPFPVAVYLFPYLIWLLYPFPSSFILFRCVAHSLSLSFLCLPIWAVLRYLYRAYVYGCLSCPTHIICGCPGLFCFLFLVFPLLNPFLAIMSSAGYSHARFVLSGFFSFILFSDRVRPQFVFPLSCDHSWIRSGPVNNVRYTTTCATLCHFLCFVFNLSSSCDIGEPGMGSAPLPFLGS